MGTVSYREPVAVSARTKLEELCKEQGLRLASMYSSEPYNPGSGEAPIKKVDLQSLAIVKDYPREVKSFLRNKTRTVNDTTNIAVLHSNGADSWNLDVYGSGNIKQMQELALKLATACNVDILVNLVQLQERTVLGRFDLNIKLS